MVTTSSLGGAINYYDLPSVVIMSLLFVVVAALSPKFSFWRKVKGLAGLGLLKVDLVAIFALPNDV